MKLKFTGNLSKNPLFMSFAVFYYQYPESNSV
jgi:hypothetical protein